MRTPLFPSIFTKMPIVAGSRCLLSGLRSMPHLNGRPVVVLHWDDARGRWACRPDGWAHPSPSIAAREECLAPRRAERSFEDAAFETVLRLAYPYYEEANGIAERLNFHAACEYGEPHHEAMREAFEASRGKGKDEIRALFRAAGERIAALGGLQAMRGVFYSFLSVLADVVRGSEADAGGLSVLKTHLEHAWDGVGGWVV